MDHSTVPLPHENGKAQTAEPEKSYPAVFYSPETEAIVIKHILHSHFEEALTILQNVVEENLGKRFVPYVFLELKCRFISTLLKILQTTGALKYGVKLQGFNLSLEVYGKSPQEIKEDLLVPFRALQQEYPKMLRDKEDLAKRITGYIDGNIQEDISLSDLAAYMGLSTSYTSKLFKEVFNENFKHYVNMRKIELSKPLLLQGLRLSDVAASTGFLHTDTFVRTFKRHVGISPREFIQNTK